MPTEKVRFLTQSMAIQHRFFGQGCALIEDIETESTGSNKNHDDRIDAPVVAPARQAVRVQGKSSIAEGGYGMKDS